MILVHAKSFDLKAFSELYNDLCDGIETVNSTFTMHTVFLMTDLVLKDVFIAYTALRQLFAQARDLGPMIFVINLTWISIQYAIKSFIAHAGNITKLEADKSIFLTTKVLANMHSKGDERLELVLLAQMRCRNKKIENIFFVIDWSLVLTVSLSRSSSTPLILYLCRSRPQLLLT